MLIKNILRDLIPPVIWRFASKSQYLLYARASNTSKWEHGVEQPSEYYDERFHASRHWSEHYTKSHYYPLWSVIADRMIRADVTSVLDIGCGSGQVASLLRDKGIHSYTGVDFSQERINQAGKVCPEYEFIVTDIFNSNLLEIIDYGCFLATEFLEHVDLDTEVLKRLKPNTFVLATVPNYGGLGHVRHFKNVDEVKERYNPYVRSLRVDEHFADHDGHIIFIMEGYANK